MTTDPRALPPETLAAIAERAEKAHELGAKLKTAKGGSRALAYLALWKSVADVPALLAHAAYLAERLAEAEENLERGIITDDKSIESALLEYWGERSDDKPNRMVAHRAYCYRAFQEAKTLTDLTAQLERERADHAATVADIHARSAVSQRLADDALTVTNMDLATEKATRLAAEGREAELRAALDAIANSECYIEAIDGRSEVTWNGQAPWHIAISALASPDRGAGDVLAAAEAFYDADDACISADSPDSLTERGELNYAKAMRTLLFAVETWRARRSGGEGG